MHRIKRDIWKVAFVLVGLLFILVVMMWVTTSAAEASNSIAGLPTPTPTVRATPIEDATVTALNKEKLQKDIEKDQSGIDKDRSDIFWSWTAALTVFGGIITAFITAMRYFNDRQAEREKAAAEREKEAREALRLAIVGLGSENNDTKVGAVTSLRALLISGYERYYQQIFELAIANLRARRTESDQPEPLDAFKQALIALFKDSYPLARDTLKERYPKSRFNPRSLDATGIIFDNAYLVRADLRQAWMPFALLRNADLLEANLSNANLNGADLSGSDLSYANLTGADLSEANLRRANLRASNLNGAILLRANLAEAEISMSLLSGAFLREANLRGANLIDAKISNASFRRANFSEVNLSRSNLTNTDLTQTNIEEAQSLQGTDLSGVKGLTEEQLKACKAKGAIIDKDATTSSSQSTVSPPPPSQSNVAQASTVPPAQVNTPSPNTDGSSSTSSQPSTEP